MQVQRSDIIGAVCAALALGLIAWLSLDSWAISRCAEVMAADAASDTPEQAEAREACKAREAPAPQGEAS